MLLLYPHSECFVYKTIIIHNYDICFVKKYNLPGTLIKKLILRKIYDMATNV